MKRTTRSAAKRGAALAAANIHDVSVSVSTRTKASADKSDKEMPKQTKGLKGSARGKKKFENQNDIPSPAPAMLETEDSESLPDIIPIEGKAATLSTTSSIEKTLPVANRVDDDIILLLSDSDNTPSAVTKRASRGKKPVGSRAKAKSNSITSAKRAKKGGISAEPELVDLLSSSCDSRGQSVIQNQDAAVPMDVCEVSEAPGPLDVESCDSVPVLSNGTQGSKKNTIKTKPDSTSIWSPPRSSSHSQSSYEDNEKPGSSKDLAPYDTVTKGFAQAPMECSSDDDFHPSRPVSTPFAKRRRSKNKIHSSSSEKEGEESGPEKEYGFVSRRKDFSSMISEVQGKLKGPANLTSSDLMAKNRNDPVARKLLAMTSKKKTGVKSAAAAYSSGSSFIPATRHPFSSSTVTASFKKNHLNSIDQPVTASQLAIADLDTDTELQVEDAPQRKKHLKSASSRNLHRKNGTHSSSDDDPATLDDSFENFLKRNDKKSQPCASKEKETEIPSTSVAVNDWIPEITSSPKTPKTPVALRWQQGYISIRIRFRGNVVKFDGNEMWDVSNVRKILAEKTNVQPQSILLYTHNDVKMNDGQQLLVYGIETGDVLEATLKSAQVQVPEDKPKDRNIDLITLKFQKSGLKKPIFLDVSKYNDFSDIRDRVAQELKLDPALLSFQFDGETIALTESPADLDIENEECIDVFEKS